MKQTCCICGEEEEEYFMDSILTGGSRAKWICTKCRSKGDTEVAKSEVAKKRKRFAKKSEEANRK